MLLRFVDSILDGKLIIACYGLKPPSACISQEEVEKEEGSQEGGSQEKGSQEGGSQEEGSQEEVTIDSFASG